MEGKLIEEFMSITGANQETAKYYLEISNGDINNSVALYFQEGNLNNNENENEDETDIYDQNQNQFQNKTNDLRKENPPPKKTTNRETGGIKTFNDYNKKDEEEGTNYYAGGEKSGIAIQDPNDKKKKIQIILWMR